MSRTNRSAVLLLSAWLTGACGAPIALEGGPQAPAPQPVAIERCALDDTPFDPHGGGVIQAVDTADGWCVRIEREPLAVRRGTEWRALSLRVHGPGFDLDVHDGAELAYHSAHHNCMDAVSAPAVASLAVTIDGASVDPDVCFSDRTEDWQVVVELDGARQLLAPWPAPGQ